jgi:deoxyguanosine kinase
MAMGSKKLFVVFEGVDGSGKSTVAELVAKQVHGMYLKSPPLPFSKLKQNMLETAAPAARLVYFIASNIEVTQIVNRTLPNKHVIVDRYLWSTFAYHSAIEGIPLSSMRPIWTVLASNLRLPDYVVFLTTKRRAQLRRISDRSDDALQVRLLKSSRFQRNLRRAYGLTKRIWPVPWIEIDTSEKSARVVAREVVKKIWNRV